MLKSAKVRKSDTMMLLTVYKEDHRLYGGVIGIEYADIVADKIEYYAIEDLEYHQYAALYVPDYTIQIYGEEVTASEALREYGFNRYNENIKCPDEIRLSVLRALDGMQSKIFMPEDKDYDKKCIKQFRAEYEGKPVPQWESDKSETLTSRWD